MDFIFEFLSRLLSQLTTPALGFLFAGVLLAAVGSTFRIPKAIYQFSIFMLLMKIGLGAGMAIRDADLMAMALPALFAAIIGVMVVLIGNFTLAQLPGVKRDDAIATAGLFGAVSASTLVAGMLALEQAEIAFEPWVIALYPFMDIPALVFAVVLANIYLRREKSVDAQEGLKIWPIIQETLTGFAVSVLLIGVVLGMFINVQPVYDQFFDPLFVGFISILMLTLGMDAYFKLKDMLKVAHWYVFYAFLAPFVHGLLAFGLGYLAHIWVGLSPGGVILLAVIAASSSDVSGPPTLRAGISSANPSAYIGTSTGIGTPVAIALCIPFFITLGANVFNL